VRWGHDDVPVAGVFLFISLINVSVAKEHRQNSGGRSIGPLSNLFGCVAASIRVPEYGVGVPRSTPYGVSI
jgi:hypothetical protein